MQTWRSSTKFLSVVAALFLLAACSTEPQEPVTNPNLGAPVSGPVAGSQDDLRINGGGDTVYFTFDSSVLSPEAQRTLSANSSWLMTNDVSVTIEGHADQRGTREYNLALGERRANSVQSYLVSLGVPSNRLLTVSYGEERPADPANNETAWQLNRRVVLAVGQSS